MPLTLHSAIKNVFLTLTLTTLSWVSLAQQQAPEPDLFGQCLERLQQQALKAGVSENTRLNVLGKLKPLPKINCITTPAL